MKDRKMSKLPIRIAEGIQSRLNAWVQLTVALALLVVSVVRPFGIELPAMLSAGLTVAGIGLLGTSMLPLAMSPFDASEWDELSGTGQLLVLSLVTVGIFAFVGVVWVL